MVKYFCDRCNMSIPQSRKNTVMIAASDGTKTTYHYCAACYKGFINLLDCYQARFANVSQQHVPEPSEDASSKQVEPLVDTSKMRCVKSSGKRKNNNCIYAAMIYLYRGQVPLKWIPKYAKVSEPTIRGYKAQYWDNIANERVRDADYYSSKADIDYGKLLSLFSCGQTFDEIEHEFFSKRLDKITIEAILCFFVNILNLDWFYNEAEFLKILRRHSEMMYNEHMRIFDPRKDEILAELEVKNAAVDFEESLK